MIRVLDTDEWAFARLLGKSADYSIRELGTTTLATADLIKVGPKGYEHGWHFVGVPSAGELVHHATHGHGKVTHLDEHGHAHVDFGGGKKRQFEVRPHAGPSALVRRPKEGDHVTAGGAAARAGRHAEAADHYRQAAAETKHPQIAAEMRQRAEAAQGKVPSFRPGGTPREAWGDKLQAGLHHQQTFAGREALQSAIDAHDRGFPSAPVAAHLRRHAADLRAGAGNDQTLRGDANRLDRLADVVESHGDTFATKPVKPTAGPGRAAELRAQAARLREVRERSEAVRAERAGSAKPGSTADTHQRLVDAASRGEDLKPLTAGLPEDQVRDLIAHGNARQRALSASDEDMRARSHFAAVNNALRAEGRRRGFSTAKPKPEGQRPKGDGRPEVPAVTTRAASAAAVPVRFNVKGESGDPATWQATGVEGLGKDAPGAVRAVTAYVRRPGSSNRRLRNPDARVSEPTFDELMGRAPMDEAKETKAKDAADRKIRALDQVMTRSASTGPLTVYRGASGKRYADLKVGDTFTDPGFVSTALDRRVAEQSFAGSGRTLLTIHGPTGTRAVRIEGLGESEVLLNRGQTFRVVADHGKASGGARHLEVEIVPRQDAGGPATTGAAPAPMTRPQVSGPPTDVIVAKLRTVGSRDQAYRYLDGLKLKAADYRRLARELGVTVGSSDSKPKLRAALVEALAGRRLDADAMARIGQIR